MMIKEMIREMRRTRTQARGNPWGLLVASLGALVLLVGLAACGSDGAPGSASPPGTNGPRLSFKEQEHEFGPINNTQQSDYRWAFTNSGSAPLQINDIRPEPLDASS